MECQQTEKLKEKKDKEEKNMCKHELEGKYNPKEFEEKDFQKEHGIGKKNMVERL